MLSGLTVSAVAQPPAAVAAAAPAGDEPARVAVIAFQAAVTETNEFKRDFADLEKKYDPKRRELKTLNDQIDALKKQLQTQGDSLSDAARESRTRDINEKEKQLQRETEDDTNDYQQDMQQTFNGVAGKVGDLMIEYAKKNGYTLVLDGGDQQTQLVLYAQTSTDITKAIIGAYNQKSGVPDQPNPAPDAPDAPKPTAPKPHAPAQH